LKEWIPQSHPTFLLDGGANIGRNDVTPGVLAGGFADSEFHSRHPIPSRIAVNSAYRALKAETMGHRL
jgi:hypothetical protein